jgi:hypothetical protein
VSLQTTFCFKCQGHWFEDHRPATCAHLLAWGASVYGGDTKSTSKKQTEDEDMLSRMYIFRNSVGCPGLCPYNISILVRNHCMVSGCGQRVQKTTGCQHLTCGASSFRIQDWRGKGCGLDFCEVCESSLADSDCGSNNCKRPEKAKKLKVRFACCDFTD